jgi:hypothetical protein
MESGAFSPVLFLLGRGGEKSGSRTVRGGGGGVATAAEAFL